MKFLNKHNVMMTTLLVDETPCGILEVEFHIPEDKCRVLPKDVMDYEWERADTEHLYWKEVLLHGAVTDLYFIDIPYTHNIFLVDPGEEEETGTATVTLEAIMLDEDKEMLLSYAIKENLE